MRTLRIALSLLLAGAPVAAQRRAASPAPAASGDAWQLAIGTQAGLADVHPIRAGGDILIFGFPGWGSGYTSLFGAPISPLPPLYMTIPVSPKLAIEPTLDLHRTQRNGPTTVFASNLGARLDYAFGHHGFYGAAGVNILARKITGSPTFAQAGISLAGGYRFHLSGAWSGRFELSHTIMSKQKTAGIPPLTVTALSFGAMVALR